MKYIRISDASTCSGKEKSLKNLEAEYELLQEKGIIYSHRGYEHSISIAESNFENILFIYRHINDIKSAEESIKLLSDKVNIFTTKGDIITLTIEEFNILSKQVFQERYSIERDYIISKAAILNSGLD
ncbi:hypothetical protein NGC32_08480 [Kluyvera cryocrescens]|uniref:hypothetical protein n=1 Tax=Kluyvera cryocrescens TaxID=580 RepID=UPI002DBAF681|nr:hypothetical protein [Kluyvera cryocrescens]MEB7712764.1 hypothetical protein [Kluyvera cryocrescens]